jgi:two-component system, OmpR family, sensor histidine kinase QseC
MASIDSNTWSLRTRLLWQLLLAIGLLLAGLFMTLDALIDRAMFRQLDQFLASRTEALAEQLQHDRHAIEKILPAWDIAGHTDFFAIYDAQGQLRAWSMSSGEGALQMPQGEHGNLVLPDGHVGRYRVWPLKQGQFAGGTLVLATERESWDRTERTIHGTLGVGILLTTIAAVLLCLLLVRQAFVHMDKEARRLPHDRPPEAGSLASTPRELHPFVEAAHAALRKSWNMAERERRFSRNVAHELRTPVAEVSIVVEHALREPQQASNQHALLQIQQANTRMARGIEALLALVRFESGQERPQADPLELTALLRQQVKALETAGLSEQIEWHLPVEAWGVCDAGMLERIVANLLQNAVEYGDANTAIHVVLQSEQAGWWLKIRNRASALTTDDLAHFGERHWRGDRDADSRHAGLGLALVHTMAMALALQLQFTLHEGELQVVLGPITRL